jgi:hypothetical protein
MTHGDLTAEDERENGIRSYHQPHRDKWGDEAPDYCADCFLLARIAHVRETGCEGLREALQATSEALIWASGSDSFSWEGEAHEGWVRLAMPALDKARAALAAPATSPEEE